MKIKQVVLEKKRWDELTPAEKQASYDRRKNTVRQWRQSQDQMDPTIAFPPKRERGGSLTGNREVTAVDDFQNLSGPQVAAGTGADGPAGRYAPRQVAAGTGADGPAGRYAPRQVAAGTGADGPAGRYAPKQVAAGTGASGPPGRNYATPKPSNTVTAGGIDLPNTPPPGTKVAELPNTPPPGTQVASGPNTPPPGYATPKPAQGVRPGLQNQLDSMMKNAGLDRKQAMPNTPPPGQQPVPQPLPSPEQNPLRIGQGTLDQNWLDKIRQQMEKPIGKMIGGGRKNHIWTDPDNKPGGVTRKELRPMTGGTPKKGDDNWEWYNKPGTILKPGTAKYADTGEAPEIEKPQGNLLKWLKAKGTGKKNKTVDRDIDGGSG